MNYCKTCSFRDINGYCLSVKLSEDIGQENTEDMLLYDYTEGGGFWVGEKFGCVHHQANCLEES